MAPPGTTRRLSSVEDVLAQFYKKAKSVLRSEVVILTRVSLLVTATGLLLLLSIVLGSRRRRSRSLALKAVLFASYTMTAYLIAYTMTLMLNPDESFAGGVIDVWLVFFLMLAFGSADSFSSYSLLDNEQWRRSNWQSALKISILLFLLYPYFPVFNQRAIAAATLCFFVVILLKVSSKNRSLEASSRYALERSNKLIVEYMEMEYKDGDAGQVDPASMKGYGYLVRGEEVGMETLQEFKDKVDRVVTLEKVWNCDGKVLSSVLKDLCMSFSFFKLLRLRYAGYKLPQETREKMSRLIQQGLLNLEDNVNHERVFRVLEDELAFLFDSFYTKLPLIFQPRRFYIRTAEFCIIALVMSVLILWLSVIVTKQSTYNGSWRDIAYYWSALISTTTYFLAEVTQFFLLLYTRWAKVVVVCGYVRHASCRKCMEKMVRKICGLRSSKPWERKLHQYSFLRHYKYRPSKVLSNKFLSMFIVCDRDGRKEDRPIDLSEEMKEAVLDRLKDMNNSSRLGNGSALLTRHDVFGKLSWACRLKTQTEVIMVWHIATAMCEECRASSSESRRNFRVATSLSKYLAYLVGFAPRLLPDHPYMTESLFDQMIKDARRLLKGHKTERKRVGKLREIPRPKGSGDVTTLHRGAELGNIMLNEIGETNLIWAILADFWVETMLYVAPSKDVTAHAERLAEGGEFVTHIWVLLYHMGIKREKRSPPNDSGANMP